MIIVMHILASGTITITRNKGVIFEVWALFTDCISEKNNTQRDNTEYIDVGRPMYNLTEYSDAYSKTSGSLWQYFRDDPNDDITQSESLKHKIEITGNSPDAGNTKDV